MQPQILRVDNIEESIRENGLEFYVDRLLQDRRGIYYYIEFEDQEHENSSLMGGWHKAPYEKYHHENGVPIFYRISKIPKDIAWFCIDAIKLKTQVINIGNGTYGDGPHGGDIQYFIKDGDQFKEIPVKAVRVETL